MITFYHKNDHMKLLIMWRHTFLSLFFPEDYKSKIFYVFHKKNLFDLALSGENPEYVGKYYI